MKRTTRVRATSTPIVFRLKPDPKGTLYIRVLVFPSQAAMYRHEPVKRRHAACCTGERRLRFRRNRRPRLLPVFAEACFYRGMLTMEIVTHELFHATIAYGRRIGFTWSRFGDDDAVNKDEERMTYAHGELCKQFVLRAIKAGLYDNNPKGNTTTQGNPEKSRKMRRKRVR